MTKADEVPWGKTLRAMKSGSCTGVQGVIIAAVSAWAELRQEDVLAAIESWVQAGGLELVKTKKAKEAGDAMLAACPQVKDRMWSDLVQNPILARMLLFTFFEATDTYDAVVSKMSDKERVRQGQIQMKEYGEMLLAERIGQAAVAHPAFEARYKAIQRERRDQRMVDKVHAR